MLCDFNSTIRVILSHRSQSDFSQIASPLFEALRPQIHVPHSPCIR